MRSLAPFLSLGLLLAGCTQVPPASPLPQPAAPAVGGLRATGDGATVSPAGVAGTFAATFPAGPGKPAAVLTFSPTDINDHLGLAVDVRNLGTSPAQLYADLNADTWVRGHVSVPPGETATLHVFARRQKLSPALAARFPGMHGVPGGKMSLWAGIEEPIFAHELRVFTVAPSVAATVELSHVRPFGSSALPDVPALTPFADRYGQYKHKDWPGKIRHDADLAAARTREDADLAAHPGPAAFNQYGGWRDGPQLAATGHFRVQKHDGRWWFVDPAGRLFWSNGLDCVGFAQSATFPAGREHFYDDVPPDGNFLTRNLAAKYGAGWRDLTFDRLMVRLRSWGLNTIGGSADDDAMARRQVPYTIQIWTGRRATPVDLDSPEWAARMRTVIADAAARINGDPWCIGYFIDNEIHVSQDPAWWERYYRTVSAVARELIPHKLYLGSRLDYHDWPDVEPWRHEVVRAAARYCDVISFNFYKFTLDDFVLPEGVDKPALIGEFHFGALDRGQLHTGLRSVLDQTHRAECYRTYVTSALRSPHLVGAHWFQCYDQAVTGRRDGENYQIGFLDICDTPYAETIAAARDIGYRLYEIRSGR